MSDVVLLEEDTSDRFTMTIDIMQSCPENIVSFEMALSPFTTWQVEPVLQILPKCNHLTTLFVRYNDVSPGPELVNVIPKLVHLDRIGYSRGEKYGDSDVDSRVVRAILQLTQLIGFALGYLILDNNALIVPLGMTQLRNVDLYCVKMSAAAWDKFHKRNSRLKQNVKITGLPSCT